MDQQPSSYVCDTLPAPRLAADPPVQPPVAPPMVIQPDLGSTPRKLCVRHQRMADEGTNLKLQQVCLGFLPYTACTTNLP